MNLKDVNVQELSTLEMRNLEGGDQSWRRFGRETLRAAITLAVTTGITGFFAYFYRTS